ncbi:hypothetical protein, partial [Anabaena sp. 4-3]|uniref:beta strand repeat-containing protein n=1 Tax=Anabaena sp. 4-3 TaxID=1811979 RepID=UPI0018D41C5D
MDIQQPISNTIDGTPSASQNPLLSSETNIFNPQNEQQLYNPASASDLTTPTLNYPVGTWSYLTGEGNGIFWGTDQADSLYLQVGIGNSLEFSSNGTDFYQSGLVVGQDSHISVNLGFGNDSLYIDSSLTNALNTTGAKLTFDGGEGNDSVFGPNLDTTWNITSKNAGNVGSIEFENVENLKAAANNYATFVFTPEGSLDGIADGGDGNLGTLVIDGGTYNNAQFIAYSPHSGIIHLDDKTIEYAGLAPIFDTSVTADRVFTATEGDDQILVSKVATGQTRIFSSNNTFENITFWNPSNSLTIKGLAGNDIITIDSLDANFTKSLVIEGNDGNDQVNFEQDLTLNGGNLTVDAESIFVKTGVTIDTTQPGGIDGTINFTASDSYTENDPLRLFDSLSLELLELKKMNLTRAVQINLTGATIKAGDINMSVSSSLTGQVEDYILAQLDLTSNATISVIDSRIESSGNVTLSSSSVVKGEILAAGQAVIGYAILLAQGLWDAGNATSNINSSAIAHISGKSSLDAKGDLSITSTNEVDVTTEGLARPISLLDGAELGGGIAVARITNTTQAYIDISDNQSISAANIALLADSKNEIETRGKSATLGVTRNNDPVSELTEGQTTAVLNRFGLDWFDRAGALAFTKLNSQTQAYISADDVDNPSSINTTGKLTINANTNNNIKSEADSTFTVTQIPVVFASDSIAGNLVDIETSAYISGNTSIHAGGIDITAITDGTINSTAFGSSSADSNFAINTIQASTIAAITNTATIQVGDDNTLSMRAEDKTTIESFSLGAVISDKFLQENKTNIAVGIANARNQIDNTIKAYIGSSTVSSSSDNNVNITIEALSSNTITSESLAVALGASTSAKSLSAGGALSNNFIRTKTNAYISYSTLTDNIGDVTITANNNANINATVVATAASVGSGLAGGIGAAVANNYIGYDNDDNNTRNPAEVQAYIQNSRITSDGNLTLNAESSGSITAGVGAGSVAVAIPSLPDPKKPKAKFGEAFAISGSGVFTENQIATLVKAFVDSDGTTSIQTKSAIISAQDSSIIKADAGAASLAASAAATTGGSLAIGVALASNLISNEVEAYISNINSNTDINPDKSFKTTTGNISLSATSNGTIEAISVAASLAAGFGTTGIALSGAGGESKNTILTKTNAYISNSVVDSANGVSLTATNSANIDATIAAVSASAGGGGATGVGVAIGAAVANNYIGYEGDSRDPLEPEAYWRNSTRNPIQVQAYLQNSSVTATGDLTLSAVANNNINAGVGAGAMAVAAGGAGGGSGSGSGVNTVNKIATLVKAFVDGYGTTGIQTKSAIISAQDSSTIKADAGAASLAASFAGATGGSLAIGVALASNLISNEVEAYISNANSNTDSNTDKSFKTTTGDISLSATTDATIEAISVAASLAAGFGGAAGIALSGAGAESKNTILTKTNAYISNSVVDSASGVSLTAENSANIDATIAAVSASAGGGAATGVGVAIGAAVANNFIGYDGDTRNPAQVQAYLQNSSVTATGDLTLSAVANSNINAGVGAGAMAVAAGGAGGGSGSGSGVNTVNKVGTLVKAFVDGDRTTGIQTKSAIISAQDSSTIKADAGAASLAASFAGAVGVSLSIGVALADNLISNEVEAYINNADNSFKTTTGNISLSATTDATIEAVSVAASLAAGFGVAAGIALSGAGAESKNTILGKTNAYISNSVVDSASGVSLTAENSANIDATIAAVSASAGGGGAAGVGVAIGAAVANNFIGYDGYTRNPAQVQAYLQNSSVMATGDLTL